MDVDSVLITNDIFEIQKKPFYMIEDNIKDTVYYQYQAQSNSNSSLIWNNQLPGLNLMMDKNVLIDTYINLLIRCTGVPIGSTAFQLGQTDYVQNFPFNRLINT
jgi:hypothetical protein